MLIKLWWCEPAPLPLNSYLLMVYLVCSLVPRQYCKLRAWFQLLAISAHVNVYGHKVREYTVLLGNDVYCKEYTDLRSVRFSIRSPRISTALVTTDTRLLHENSLGTRLTWCGTAQPTVNLSPVGTCTQNASCAVKNRFITSAMGAQALALGTVNSCLRCSMKVLK